MKTKLFIIYILLIAVLFGACFSPWEGGEGNLTVVWENTGNSRAFVKEVDLPGLSYVVTLTGPGAKQEESFTGVPSASFKVIPGLWTVTVKGYRTGLDGTSLEVMGIEQVEVTAGKNDPRMIRIYTATEVYDWYGLYSAVYYGNSLELGSNGDYREELIIIKNDFQTSLVGVTGSYSIEIERPIILISEAPVEITRDAGNSDSFFVLWDNSRLTLGLPGMTGKITFDGNNVSLSGSLIFINNDVDPGVLVLNNGVKLTGCNASDGGGVYLNNGRFIMNGGSIIGNSASAGGGVYTTGESIFTMNGGTITGNTATQYDGGGGVWVSFDSVFTMNGGTITGNTAPNERGGGVLYYSQNENDGTSFKWNGGTISGNAGGNVIYGGTP